MRVVVVVDDTVAVSVTCVVVGTVTVDEASMGTEVGVVVRTVVEV